MPPVDISADPPLEDGTVPVKWSSSSFDGKSETYKLYVTLVDKLHSRPSDCTDDSIGRTRMEKSDFPSYDLKELEPFSKYSLKIKTENSQEESEFSEIVYFYSMQAPPSKPRDIVVRIDEEELDETFVYAQLEWRSPCKLNGYKSDFHKMYTINIFGESLGLEDHVINRTTDTESLEVDEKLKRGYRYEVKITARNMIGTGEAAQFIFNTPPRVPTDSELTNWIRIDEDQKVSDKQFRDIYLRRR